MFNLINFLADEQPKDLTGTIITWVIFGLLIVGMILLMIIPQRRQKKKAAEMMSKLAIGSLVTTIGGIVGEVVELDDQHIWLLTGQEGSKTTMQFLRQAIHTIAPAPGSPEAKAEEKAAEKEENEIDEIK